MCLNIRYKQNACLLCDLWWPHYSGINISVIPKIELRSLYKTFVTRHLVYYYNAVKFTSSSTVGIAGKIIYVGKLVRLLLQLFPLLFPLSHLYFYELSPLLFLV